MKPGLHLEPNALPTAAGRKDSNEIISPASLEIQSWTTKLIQGDVDSPTQFAFASTSSPPSSLHPQSSISHLGLSEAANQNFAINNQNQQIQNQSFYYDPNSADGYSNPIASQQPYFSSAPVTSQAPYFSSSNQPVYAPHPQDSFRDPNHSNQSPFNSPFPSPLDAFRDRASSFGSEHSSNHSPSGAVLGESPDYPSLFPNQSPTTQAQPVDSTWMNSIKQVGSMSIDDQGSFPPVFDDDNSTSTVPPPTFGHSSSSYGQHRQQNYSQAVPVLAISQPSMDVQRQHYQTQQAPQWNNQSYVAEPIEMNEPFMPQRPSGYRQMGQTIADLAGRPSSKGGSEYGSPQFSSDPSPRPHTADVPAVPPPQRQPTRDDSYDRLKQFLRLDVEVDPNQPTTIMGGVRKRSLSDIGPRPLQSEFFSGRDQEMDKMMMGGNVSQGMQFMDPNGGMDLSWMDPGMRQKFGSGGLNGIGGPDFNNSNPSTVMAMAMQYQNSPSPSTVSSSSTNPSAAVDPSLLGGISEQIQNQNGSASSPFNHPSMSESPSSSNRNPFPFTNHQRNGSAGAGGPSSRPDPSVWMGGQVGGGLDHSHKASSSRRGHRRGAQSEDLRSSVNRESAPDFLAQITAPDGGLAPPNASSPAASPNPPSPAPSSHSIGGGHGRGAGAPAFYPNAIGSTNRPHPYRLSHDRHPSFGSNNSGSSFREEMNGHSDFNPVSISNMVMPAHPAHMDSPQGPRGGTDYVQNGLPTYGELKTEGCSNSPPTSYVHAKVTTEKTQQASNNRRKTEAMYACPVPACSSTFTRKYNLRGHIRSHQDERPFVCDFPSCGRAFSRSHDMKRHRNLHTNAKPYSCDVCGKTFARADALSRHHKIDSEGCNYKLSASEKESRRGSMSSNGSRNTGGEDEKPVARGKRKARGEGQVL